MDPDGIFVSSAWESSVMSAAWVSVVEFKRGKRGTEQRARAALRPEDGSSTLAYMFFSRSMRLAIGAALVLVPAIAGAADKAADDPTSRCFEAIVKDPKAAVSQAQTLYQSGQTVAARRCLGDALVAAGEAPRGARILEDLAREISAAPNIASETQGAVWGDAGRAWLEADELDPSLAAFDAAIARLPGDAQLRVDRAVALGNARRYWEAIDDLTAAINGGIGTVETYLLRATAWRQVAAPELAMEDINRAAAKAPSDPNVLLERGRIRKLSNDTTGAQKDFTAALKLSPNSDTGTAAKHELEALSARPRR
jgi:tetratricopeptide (TPR) repeat protein